MWCQHEIAITNLDPGQTLSYPLVMLKGTIKHPTSCQHDNIQVATNDAAPMPFKVQNGEFKALAELTQNQNVITLKYCSASIEVTLNYSPRATNLSILPLYIICEGHDGRFQAPDTEDGSIESALRRITLASKLLQGVVAEKLHEAGQGRKTFRLEGDCRVFRSRLRCAEARGMGQEELWGSIAREVIGSELECDRVKVLGFLSCTRYHGRTYTPDLTHEHLVKMTEAHVALGGGGLSLFGTACLYTWPESLDEVVDRFENSTVVDRYNFMDDSSYRGTLGACFSTTLGATLHELCHTLDLGHTEEGIMARGFENIDQIFVVGSHFGGDCRKKRLAERRKEFNVGDGGEEGGAFWTRSCVAILAYHRWLNDFKPSKSVIKYDPATRIVSSTAGLRVIELRRPRDDMVLSSFTFTGRVLKYSFQLPESCGNAVLFVEDNSGNILKIAAHS